MLPSSVIATPPYLSPRSIMSLERNPSLAFELELCQAAWGGSTSVISPDFQGLLLSPFSHPASPSLSGMGMPDGWQRAERREQRGWSGRLAKSAFKADQKWFWWRWFC